MKAKIKHRERDFLIDYMHVKDMHALRYKIFEFFIHTHQDNVLLYIDTNNKIRNLPIDNIEHIMESCDLSFVSEPVTKAQRKTLDLIKFFKKQKEENLMSEKIYLALINNDIPLRELYDQFLMYYDYGLCAGSNKTIQELLASYKSDVTDILFNKDEVNVSLYDSIMYCRTRTDAPYSDFELFLNEQLI